MTQKKRLGLSVPVQLHKILRDETEYTGQTLNALILQILWDWEKATRQGDNQNGKDAS